MAIRAGVVKQTDDVALIGRVAQNRSFAQVEIHPSLDDSEKIGLARREVLRRDQTAESNQGEERQQHRPGKVQRRPGYIAKLRARHLRERAQLFHLGEQELL